jgi:hypothetical protein
LPVMLCSVLYFLADSKVLTAACPVDRAYSPILSVRVVAYAATPAPVPPPFVCVRERELSVEGSYSLSEWSCLSTFNS